MPLLIPDVTRKFSLQEVRFLDLTIEDLFQNALELKRANSPDWTDESSSDFGIRLLWLFSVLSKWVTDNMERAKNNSFVGTTQSREHMKRLLELIAYSLGSSSPSSVLETFNLESGHPEFTIYMGTQVSTEETDDDEAIIFETSADQLCLVGVTEVDITCTQGETIANEILGSSDGSDNQDFELARKPVVYGSDNVQVDSGAGFSSWTRVDTFKDSGGSDEHYRVSVDEDDVYHISFGNGKYGKVPSSGTNNIKITYKQGGGIIGNVPPEVINQLVSAVSYVDSVDNASAASGGTDKETLEHARIFGPASIKTLDRAVTTDDVENIANTFISVTHGGIAISKAFVIGGVSISVMIVPRSGGAPSSGLKSELQTYLEARRMISTSVQVIDPIYQLINVSAQVYSLPNFAPSLVIDSVRARLVSFISPTYQDPETGLYPHRFGRNIYLSDLYAIIDGTPGVDHVDITVPTADVILTDYKMADVGTLSLSIVTPSDQFSYQDLSTSIN